MADIDQDTRLSIIREICRKEGHGELIETTTFEELGLMESFICQRGCGMAIKKLKQAMTIPELTELLGRKGIEGTVRLRGTIEVER